MGLAGLSSDAMRLPLVAMSSENRLALSKVLDSMGLLRKESR
jgi:dihydrodipicolinate synthase/N-acetylneuraminate lyase